MTARRTHRRAAIAFLGWSLLLGSTLAQAAEGVLEINQTCAVNTGCFAGDAAGFPVTITQPGSYRLTGNLDLTALPGVDGIVLQAAVALDLGGFAASVLGKTQGVRSRQ